MIVYNQVRTRIVWNGFGQRFELEPFGQLEVPDRVYHAMKGQKFPVALSPIAPEEKAQRVLDEEQAAARADEVRLLKQQALALEAQLKTAEETNLKEQLSHSETKAKLTDLQKRFGELKLAYESAQADAKAAEKLLEETGKNLVEATDRADQAKVKEKTKASK